MQQTVFIKGMVCNRCITTVTQELQQLGIERNTIIIFMSDNGMTPGGSGKPGKPLAEGYPFHNSGMKGLKVTPDEGGVRVVA